jgi:hypothetical protein
MQGSLQLGATILLIQNLTTNNTKPIRLFDETSNIDRINKTKSHLLPNDQRKINFLDFQDINLAENFARVNQSFATQFTSPEIMTKASYIPRVRDFQIFLHVYFLVQIIEVVNKIY